jgi:hypothetical protein
LSEERLGKQDEGEDGKEGPEQTAHVASVMVNAAADSEPFLSPMFQECKRKRLCIAAQHRGDQA